MCRGSATGSGWILGPRHVEFAFSPKASSRALIPSTGTLASHNFLPIHILHKSRSFSSKAPLLESATPWAALSCRRLTEPGMVTTRARPRQRPHPQRPMLTTRCRSLCQPEFNLSCAAPPLQGARHLLYCIPRFPLGWPARRRPPHLLGPMTRGYGSLQPGIVSRASAEQVNRDRKVCYPGTRVPLADSFRCRPNPRPLVQRWRSL